MKRLIPSLGFIAMLSGCVSAPSELYGIHQAVPEKDLPKHNATSLPSSGRLVGVSTDSIQNNEAR